MTSLLFSTHNEHKVAEIREMLSALPYQIVSLNDMGIHEAIPEPYSTLEDNSRGKARYLADRTGKDCFAEDTGLEVASLQGAPGVRSARYAGDEKNMEANIDLLLQQLEARQDRIARFRTVICLIYQSKEYIFEGICEGRIAEARKGKKGFGYDPVFVPIGSVLSFAEMEADAKNQISHRYMALDRMIAFFNQAHQPWYLI